MKRDSMNKKKGGPLTQEGKAIASKNALKHGGTSSKFLTDQEKTQYETFLNDLKNYYESDNPLVKAQIQRIARLQIQLERIQNTIDAQFKLSRNTSQHMDSLQAKLKLTEDQMSLVAKIYTQSLEVDDLKETLSEEVSVELNALVTSKKLNSQEDYLDKTPTFCNYLFEESRKKNISIEDFINQSIPKQTNQKGINLNPPNIKIVFVGVNDKSEENILDMKEAILKTSLSRLQNAAIWFAGAYYRHYATLTKLTEFTDLLPTERESAIPNLDMLDKLMRYQTTLQRQLSTAIGELLALSK